MKYINKYKENVNGVTWISGNKFKISKKKKVRLVKEVTSGLRFQILVVRDKGRNYKRIFVTIHLIIHHFHNRSVLHLHNVNNFIIHGSL